MQAKQTKQTFRNGRSRQPAPDITLTTLQGNAAALSDYWGPAESRNGRSALFIFLRHLG
jgi:hypothetical protein